jgi:hypothetical protein
MNPKAFQPGRGPREAYIVYAPSLASNLLHLSIRGESYRLRDYLASGPHAPARARVLPGLPTIDALRASHIISRWISVTRDDMAQNLVLKHGYWHSRIEQVNAKDLSDAS